MVAQRPAPAFAVHRSLLKSTISHRGRLWTSPEAAVAGPSRRSAPRAASGGSSLSGVPRDFASLCFPAATQREPSERERPLASPSCRVPGKLLGNLGPFIKPNASFLGPSRRRPRAFCPPLQAVALL